MKKIFGFFAIVFLSVALFACDSHKCTLGELHEAVPATCTTDGNVAYYECLECGQKYDAKKKKIQTEKVYAHHDLTTVDYFTYGECAVCHQSVRMSPISSAEDELYIKENNQLYTDVIAKGEELQGLFETDAVTKKMWQAYIDQYDEAYDHLIARYYYINYLYVVYYTDEYTDLKDEISKFEVDVRDSLLKTIAAAYDSTQKDTFISLEFFDQEDLDYIEEHIDEFRNEQLATLQKDIDELELFLKDEGNVNKADFLKNYAKLIDLRNQYAVIKGYNNYYEYGLTIYGREYGVEQVEKVREYYLKYLSSFMNKKYSEASSSSFRPSGNAGAFYNSVDDDVYTTKQSLSIIKDFFKTMKSDDNSVDFYEKINNAMKMGYIASGDLYQGAYSQSNSEPPYMYFQDASGYSDAFTFVHECGHYNLSIDPVLDDYDLYETHSQGAEQLFARYAINLANKKRYTAVANELVLQLQGDWAWTLSINIIADEFEQAVYENTYAGYTQYEDGITYNEYNALFTNICKKYGCQNYSSVFSQLINYYYSSGSVYEIAYAVSIIPCISLFYQSADDYEAAVQTYMKTFTYLNDPSFTDEENYANIVAYAGLGSPFEEQTYKDIAQYIK